MSSRLTRRVRLAAGITGLACAATAVSASAASAGPGDPVTSGSASFSVPAKTAAAFLAKHIVLAPTTPDTVNYDPTAMAAVFSAPVTGGDGSLNGFFGTITLDGGLIFADGATRKAVQFCTLSFAVDAQTLSAVPAGSSTPITLFDATGLTYQTDPTTGTQSESATTFTVDPAGARYLDRVLRTTVFKANQKVGSFSLTFVNTQY